MSRCDVADSIRCLLWQGHSVIGEPNGELGAGMSINLETDESQRQRKAKRAVLTALIIAFLGSLLGIVLAVIPGTVTGAEAWIISLCVTVTGGLMILVVLRPSMATGVVTGILSVYLVFHLNAGAIVAYQTSETVLRIIPYILWFFPLVLFHRFTNFGFFRRQIEVLVGLGPIPIMAYVTIRLSEVFVVEQFDAVITFLASFYAFFLFAGFYSRHREAEVLHLARAEQAEQAAEILRITDERFKLLGRATHDLIWDVDLKLGRIWWNDALLTVYGYDPIKFCDDPDIWERWVHPDDRDRVKESLRTVFEGHSDNWSCGYRFVRADGHALEVIDRGLVLRDADGAPVRMIGSTADVSEVHDLERRLRQVHKMEALGQLTGGIAHDFNNLLTIIIGNAELLTETLARETQEHQSAEATLLAAEHAGTLTSRLLSFARLQPLEPAHIELPTLFKEIEELIRRTINEDIEIQIVAPPDVWPIAVDPGQLENAILNMVINARDAMPDGGRVTIEASNMLIDDDDLDREPDVQGGQYVLIAVSDDGRGMPATILDRAFEPFFTTKEHGKGTGLGLSMVWGFVKQSNGQARIYSKPGEGTTVKLYFPKSDIEKKEVARTAAFSSAAGGSERILVVEDDEMVRSYVISQLVSLGYEIQEASSAEQALLLLDEGQTFDLLFTDVVMPGGMNGQQLAGLAKHRVPGIRVLLTSGYTEDAIVHEGRLDPGVNLLSKPYRRAQLASKIRSVLDR